MVSLIIPAFSAGPALRRTIESCSGICDETVVIATPLYAEDFSDILSVANKVVQLPWNYVFHNGFGELHNQGTSMAKNDWLMLLGLAETFAEPYFDVHSTLGVAAENVVFRCCHNNDPNTWKRVWNKNGAAKWSGIIHEEISGDIADGGIMFRMQDTPKEPQVDPVKSEAFRFFKACSYNWQYKRLREDNSLLGGTNRWWIDFVNGSAESNMAFMDSHSDLIRHCLSGDLDGFKAAVEQRVLQGIGAVGVNFQPQGK